MLIFGSRAFGRRPRSWLTCLASAGAWPPSAWPCACATSGALRVAEPPVAKPARGHIGHGQAVAGFFKAFDLGAHLVPDSGRARARRHRCPASGRPASQCSPKLVTYQCTHFRGSTPLSDTRPDLAPLRRGFSLPASQAPPELVAHSAAFPPDPQSSDGTLGPGVARTTSRGLLLSGTSGRG